MTPIIGDTVLSQHYRYKKKNILQRMIFCKNEACLNCGTHKRHNSNLVVTERCSQYFYTVLVLYKPFLWVVQF